MLARREPSRDQDHASTWYLPSFFQSPKLQNSCFPWNSSLFGYNFHKADITSRAFWLTNLQQICKLLSITNPKPSGSVSSSDAAHKRFVVDVLRRLHKTIHPLLCKVVHRSVHETTKNLMLGVDSLLVEELRAGGWHCYSEKMHAAVLATAPLLEQADVAAPGMMKL